MPYACSGIGSAVSIPEVAAAVLSLVDRGLVGVHRIEPWTAPDGRAGATYGAALGRAGLPALPADPDSWDEPSDVSWIVEPTSGRTAAWDRAGDDGDAHTDGP